MRYDDEESAQKACEELDSKQGSKFCPLTKETCTQSCVCFVPASFRKPIGAVGFYVSEPKCEYLERG